MELPEKYLASDEEDIVPRAKSKVGIASISALFVVGVMWAGFVWYSNNHYNTAFQSAFMIACENGGVTEPRCGCAYGVLQNGYDYTEAKAMIANPGGPAGKVATAAITNQCRK